MQDRTNTEWWDPVVTHGGIPISGLTTRIPASRRLAELIAARLGGRLSIPVEPTCRICCDPRRASIEEMLRDIHEFSTVAVAARYLGDGEVLPTGMAWMFRTHVLIICPIHATPNCCEQGIGMPKTSIRWGGRPVA